MISSASSVAIVDKDGIITSLSAGEANIFAEVGGVYSTCKVVVKSQSGCADVDYIDEYGINHGKGIVIGDIVWAPVNCGYKASTLDSKGFPMGKYYQWGRKFGQGYSDKYDEKGPIVIEGPISNFNGQREAYADYFISGGNWLDNMDDALWNAGTEQEPKKTEYDPCPSGWRVPTNSEMTTLCLNMSIKTLGSTEGRWFSGEFTYLDGCPRIYLPSAGYLRNYDGSGVSRNEYGQYWTSWISDSYHYKTYPTYLSFYYSEIRAFNHREQANTVRCVQE